MMNTTRMPARRSRSAQPTSTNNDAWYERPSHISGVAEEFFDSRIKLSAACPETALMYAVLEGAFLCFHKQFKTEQGFVQRAREAEDWFSAMTLAGSSPPCLSAMRSGWNRSIYGKSLNIGPARPLDTVAAK